MGIDLTLIPFDAWESRNCTANSLLELHRSGELWGAIRELPSTEIPLPIAVFRYIAIKLQSEGSDGYDHITLDAYGKPLRYVLAADLVTLAGNPGIGHAPENRAAWAYLTCLPGDTKIALLWH